MCVDQVLEQTRLGWTETPLQSVHVPQEVTHIHPRWVHVDDQAFVSVGVNFVAGQRAGV